MTSRRREAVLPAFLVVLGFVCDSAITLAMGGASVEANPLVVTLLDHSTAAFWLVRAFAVLGGVAILAWFVPRALWVVAGYYLALVGFEVAVAASVGLGLFG